MTRLGRGYYMIIDGVIYRLLRDASDRRYCVIEAVDPSAEPRVREVLAGSTVLVRINPSATYRGIHVSEIAFEDDGRAVFSVWPYPRGWAGTSELQPYDDTPARPGETVWVIRAALSDLEDFEDGIPEEWRPYMPANGVDGVAWGGQVEGGVVSPDSMVRDTRADAEYFRAVTSNLAEVCADENERVARPTGRWRAPHERGVAAGTR